jgi:hypothetical protein
MSKTTKVKIDNTPYGQLNSCLGAFNLDAMKPILKKLVKETYNKAINDVLLLEQVGLHGVNEWGIPVENIKHLKK